eukprot:888201-Amphidinium_carterae.1
MTHGMAQHLTGLNAYPSCQVQSVSFGHDADQDDPDWGSSVIFAKVQADLISEVESLLANEAVPKGQRWDVRRPMGTEFENRHVTDVLNDMAVHQNFTSGYSPQSSGAAEVNVRIIKQVMRRLLEAASFQVPWWCHALENARQVLQCRALSKAWDSPAFGEYVSVKKLEDEKKQKPFVPRGELGRLLVVRPMTDRTCEILGSRIVRGTTPRPVSDKLAESMTREERRQVLKEVISELDEE